MSLCAVGEEGDREEDGRNRQLSIMEDRAGRHTELLRAGFTAEDPSRLVFVDGQAATMRAGGLAIRFSPADPLEQGKRLVVGQSRDLDERQTSRGGRQQEMLSFAVITLAKLLRLTNHWTNAPIRLYRNRNKQRTSSPKRRFPWKKCQASQNPFPFVLALPARYIVIVFSCGEALCSPSRDGV